MSDATLHVDDALTVGLAVDDGLRASLSFGGVVYSPDAYEGEYSVTPSATRQVLATAGMALREDVTVEPIPSNYGLVTWDGSVLMVS